MRLMIDTNIFLDVLTKREPFFTSSRQALELCESGKHDGFVSASCITDIFYLTQKHFHDIDAAYGAIGEVLKIAKVLPVTNDEVLKAFIRRAADFEDCLLAECAKACGCEAIVTRNKKDYMGFGIVLYSPDELVEMRIG